MHFDRLYAKQSVDNEPQSFPNTSGAECTTEEEEALIKNYETLVQLFKQERLHVMEMWQKAAQEVGQFQEINHKAFSDGQQADAMTQKLQNQLVQFIRQSCKLKEINQEVQLTNKHLQMTEKEQNDEIEELHSQLRKTNYDLRTATDKMDEMTEQLECLEHQLKRKEDDVAEAQCRGEKQLQQLQSIIRQQEVTLKSGPENALEEQTVLETKLGTLQAHCAPLEQDKYEGLNKVHGCVHVAEASARVRERQKTVDLENKDKAIQQFIQEAAVRARKEIDNVREQCNVEIQEIVDELSHLQMECTIKEYQIERCKHEKKALEKELEKVTKHRAEQDLGKIIALHQRCLNAERIRDDMSATLQSTQSKVMKFESDSKEELSRSQAEIQRLQSSLAAAWEDCDNISEERLQLQQENLQLHRETNELQRSTLLIQNQAKNRILEMEQECKLKEQTFNAKMMALEERSHNLNADRMHLLTAHQKSIQRSKDEAANMTKAFEARIQQLMTEMNQHKQRLHEVELQLRNNQDTMNEYGSQLAEYQEKSICLQRRATDAEQRAATATQQLSVLTSQRMSSSEAA
ncbi:sodium channel and clathrin linker 1-like isoform X7 [Phycodurus eques]|uniref:sodium channel and clathrin linker 1-like isoform X7 n=1 Tax=Phycodurus eques TaxID=693459 RepID=UPI002ACDA2F7|nr:sodium channel and clathrin linker 1-like isoform X7 [Phycodurus eques]